MKKIIFLLVIIMSCIRMNAQVPQGFNYQAIARDSSGNPIVNHSLPVRITIQSDSLGGTTFWIEEHSSVTTNSFGLFTLILGKGVRLIGSAMLTFNDIDWSVTPKYIKTEINHNGWKNMGSSRLWTVPYSMVAGNISGTVKKLTVKGESNDMEEALFEVKNKNGQTVFAVYNDGVRIYVNDGPTKGSTKGGFAIGGFGTDKGTQQNYLVVNPDSIRAYIDTNPAKGSTKGGFAIGGFDEAKTPGQEYLRVTRDSTRVYLNDNGTKTTKGGFAIGGFGSAKGLTKDYLLIRPDSTNFYVQSIEPDISSTFNIFAINQNQVRKSLLKADADTIGITGVLNLQNNLVVMGNINISGTTNQDTSHITDRDGNTYKTIRIGSQVWIAEDLKTTKYNDGTAITLVTDNSEWVNLTMGAYCWYNNDVATNKVTYGALYNWYAVNTGYLCPQGWHVPSNDDWAELSSYLGGEGVGGKLKETGIVHWTSPNTGATNESGFTALPAGIRNDAGEFDGIGSYTNWWTSSMYEGNLAYYWSVSNNSSEASGNNGISEENGAAVRCLKDWQVVVAK